MTIGINKIVSRSEVPVSLLEGEDIHIEEYIFSWGADVTQLLGNRLTGDKIAVIRSGTCELVRETIPDKGLIIHSSRATDESIRVLTEGDTFGEFEWVDKEFENALDGRKKDKDVWKIYAGLVTCTPWPLSAGKDYARENFNHYINRFIKTQDQRRTDFPLPRFPFDRAVLTVWLVPSSAFDKKYLLIRSFRNLATYVNLSSRFAQRKKYNFMPNLDSSVHVFHELTNLKKLPLLVGAFFDALFHTENMIDYGEVGYKKYGIRDQLPNGVPSFLSQSQDSDFLKASIDAKIWPLMVPTKARPFSGAECLRKDLYFPIGYRSAFILDLKYAHPHTARFDETAHDFIKEMFRRILSENYSAGLKGPIKFIAERIDKKNQDALNNGWIPGTAENL